MNDEELKKTADELMLKKGNMKGDALGTHAAFIRYKEGEDGVRKVEEKMEQLGYPIRFKDISIYNWYPVAQILLCMIVAKEIFNWKDSDIEEAALFTIKNSSFIKLYFKFFVSLEKLVQLMPQYWEKNYDFGKIEITYDKENEKAHIRIKDYDFHPLNCLAFKAMGREFIYLAKGKKPILEETKCTHKGDPYHEYLVTWK
jgi:hypothetical protein